MVPSAWFHARNAMSLWPVFHWNFFLLYCSLGKTCVFKNTDNQDRWEPSWVRDSTKLSLHRWECAPQKLPASVTGQSNTASGKGPVLGLHLSPGGGPNARYLCTFPVRGELASRESSEHWNSEERVCLPGLLIDGNRITRRTISKQSQL